MSPKMDFVAQLATAEAELVRAEKALDSAMAEVEVLPRAQKMAVSAAVSDAFTALRAARDRVAALRGAGE